MISPVKLVVRFFLLIFVQVYVLNQIPPLGHLASIYLYFLFILWLPLNMNPRTQLILSFLLGFTLDAFTHTYGLHAAACVLIGYIRPHLINLLSDKETLVNYKEPGVASLGWMPYLTFLTLLTFIHHFTVFFLEALQTGGIVYFLVKTVFSVAISLLLILITELLFSKRKRVRMNNA